MAYQMESSSMILSNPLMGFQDQGIFEMEYKVTTGHRSNRKSCRIYLMVPLSMTLSDF